MTIEKLTDDERVYLSNGDVSDGPKALRIIDALTERAASLEAQAQRDHALAAEWQATAEGYRVELGVARDRAEAAERDAKQARDMSVTARMALKEDGEQQAVIDKLTADRDSWQSHAFTQESKVADLRRLLVAAESECAALRAQLKDGDDADAAMRDLCAALRAEVKQLSEALSATQQEQRRIASERDELRAEVEKAQQSEDRMRAEVERWEAMRRCNGERVYDELADKHRAAESHLAAATELVAQLGRRVDCDGFVTASEFHPLWQLLAAPGRVSDPPAAPETDHEGRPMTYWGGRPAAPTRAEADSARRESPQVTPAERNLRAQLDAANIQISSLERDVRELRVAVDIKTGEIERIRIILGPNAALRTDAEQRVLKEAERAEIVSGCNRGMHCCAVFKDARYLAAAELARRESQKAKSNV